MTKIERAYFACCMRVRFKVMHNILHFLLFLTLGQVQRIEIVDVLVVRRKIKVHDIAFCNEESLVVIMMCPLRAICVPFVFPLIFGLDSFFVIERLLFTEVLFSFEILSGAIQSKRFTSSISTISTPSSGSEYTSTSSSIDFSGTSSIGSFFSEGADVRVSPSPSFDEEALPNGTGGAKFERGCVRRAEVPDMAGPSAKGPLATSSTGARGGPPRPSSPLPRPRPRPRPRPESADFAASVGLASA